MNQVQIFLLTLTFISLIIISLIIYRLYVKAKLDSLKYRLFAVRDELIRLVVEEKLSEEDFLFKELYPMVNELIKNIREIKLETLLKVSQDQLGHIVNYNFNRLFSELDESPEEVRTVVLELFNSLGLIIVNNDKLLFMAIRLHIISISYFKRLVELTRKIFPISYGAYKQYNEIENLKMKLNLVPT